MRIDTWIARRRWMRTLAALATLSISLMAQTPQPVPKLGDGESLFFLHITLRGNYVVPSQVSLPEGWCRIVVHDPTQVGGGQQIVLSTEAGIGLSSKNLASRSSKAEMYYRLSPGMHKIRIGAKNEWIVQVEVFKKTK
jgi:hypothetical protein